MRRALPDVKAERIQRWKGREDMNISRAQIFIRLLRTAHQKKYENKNEKSRGEKKPPHGNGNAYGTPEPLPLVMAFFFFFVLMLGLTNRER